MRKKARTLGLTDFLQTNPTAKKAVNMAMALPLLPKEQVVTGYNNIKAYAEHNGVGAVLKPFLEYVQHTWIEGRLYTFI